MARHSCRSRSARVLFASILSLLIVCSCLVLPSHSARVSGINSKHPQENIPLDPLEAAREEHIKAKEDELMKKHGLAGEEIDHELKVHNNNQHFDAL